MRNTARQISLAALCVCGVGVATAAPAPTEAPLLQPAVWQTRHARFDYFGITTRYTCDGLEGKVRQILQYLGARSDVYVQASGCPRGPESLTRTATVRVDFSTLVAAPAEGAPGDVVPGAWIPLKLVSQRPMFMGDGDCELMHDMRALVTENFSWRGQVDYRTDCPIETTQLYDYQVQGDVLKLSPASASVTR